MYKRQILDCCTHTGAFALNCAKAGAAHVTAVDISKDAVALTRRNVARNGLEDRVDVVQADVFSLLTELAREKKHPYDYIILDPPAFTKSGATVKNAYRGDVYKRQIQSHPTPGHLSAFCGPAGSVTQRQKSAKKRPILEPVVKNFFLLVSLFVNFLP